MCLSTECRAVRMLESHNFRLRSKLWVQSRRNILTCDCNRNETCREQHEGLKIINRHILLRFRHVLDFIISFLMAFKAVKGRGLSNLKRVNWTCFLTIVNNLFAARVNTRTQQQATTNDILASEAATTSTTTAATATTATTARMD